MILAASVRSSLSMMISTSSCIRKTRDELELAMEVDVSKLRRQFARGKGRENGVTAF